MLAIAPTDSTAVKGWGAIFTGQARWKEAAIGPGQLIHLEAEPRVRGRAVVQRAAEFYKLSSPKNAAAVRTWPIHPPCGPHSIKSLTQWIEKMAETTFQPKWSVFIVAKPTEKNKATDV